jgi:putative transposase
LKIPEKYNSVVHDEYKIMPIHLHGIIMLFNDPHWNQNKSSVGADPCVRPNIKQIMQWFKTMSTNDYIKGVNEGRFQPFEKKIWQRSFYDRIIRNKKEFEFIQEYIFLTLLNGFGIKKNLKVYYAILTINKLL